MKPKQSNNKKQLLSFVSPFSALPLLYVPFVSEHIPSPHVPLHNMGSNSKNRAESAEPSVLDYDEGQLMVASAWNGAHHALSIFGTRDMVLKDAESIHQKNEKLYQTLPS